MDSYQYNLISDSEFLKVASSWWPNDDVFSLFKNPMYERYYVMWHYSKIMSSISGDFVECGVYNGSTANIMASHCKSTLHLIDSWEGISEIGKNDNPIYEDESFGWTNYKFKYELEKTKQNLSNYDNIKYYKGWIPEVLNINADIAFLHLDLDLYEPTKKSLEYFWDKVVEGGIVMSDFHDEVATGAAKATRDFFKGIKNIEILPTGKAIIKK